MRIKNYLFIGLLSATVLFSGCESPNSTTTEDSDRAISKDEPIEIIETDEVSIMLPPAIELLTILKEENIEYQDGVTLPIDLAESYNTQVEQYLALGAYSADITYNVLYGQSQQTLQYFNTALNLGEKLGLREVFAKGNFPERFEANINNSDSLMNMIYEFMANKDEYYDDSDLLYLSYISYAGAWLESIHIGISCNKSFDNEDLSIRLAEQMKLLKDIITLLKISATEIHQVQNLIRKFEVINENYYNLEKVKASEEGRTPTLSLTELGNVAEQLEELYHDLFKTYE